MSGPRGHIFALAATIALGAGLAVIAYRPLRGPAVERGQGATPTERARDALLKHAAANGLVPATDEPAEFLDPPDQDGVSAAFISRRFVFLAQPSAGASDRDVFLARARVAPNGNPISVEGFYNLTDTPDAREARLIIGGSQVAFATRFEGVFTGVTLLDLSGEHVSDGVSLRDRLTRGVTNYVRLGDRRGLHITRLVLDQSTVDLRLRWAAGGLVVARRDNAGWSEAHVVDGDPPLSDAPWLQVQAAQTTRPSLISWAVDTARSVPWIGPGRIYAMEKAFFKLADSAQTRLGSLGDAEAGAERAALEDFEEASSGEPSPPDAGGPTPGEDPLRPSPGPLDEPPAPISPRLSEGAPHEGRWRAFDYVPRPPGAPPRFWRTVIRFDPARPDAFVALVLIDPRQLRLGVVAGTEHPRSTTGAVGLGVVPKADRPRTLAAFNGGFQAIHGRYGMAVNRRVLLPPLANAATVAVYQGGALAFGAWPAGQRAPLPPGLRSFRQNLPPLVMDSEFNPLDQSRWGWTVKGTDPIYTWRSGLGVTRRGRLLFALCTRCSAEGLAEVMIAAGAEFAMHLDMNVSNVDFEWWRRSADTGRIHTKHLLRTTWRSLAPRYSRAQSRDFMYLATRAPYTEALAAVRPASIFGGGRGSAWPSPIARGALTSPDAGEATVLILATPRLTATADPITKAGSVCALHVHRGVLGDGFPSSETGGLQPKQATLLINAADELSLLAPGAEIPARAFYQQLPVVDAGGATAEMGVETRRGPRWLLAADAAGHLLLLGGELDRAALARAAVDLGGVVIANPAPLGGVPRFECGSRVLIDGDPLLRRHEIRLGFRVGAPVRGRPFVWRDAPPERL